MERIHLNSKAAEAVQAYIEYENIVGGADGGKMLSPAEYEEFKQKVAAQRANRLFVYWTNIEGLECKTIGPFSKCFCDHRYKDHATDNLKSKIVPCKVPKCKCKHFNYVPIYGSNDLKCLCKHSFREHDKSLKKCERPNCKCSGFSSTHSCACSMHYNSHKTHFYTKDERIAMGKPVDNLGGGGEMYAALGGLTDFSDLVDGIERGMPAMPRVIESEPGRPDMEMVVGRGLGRGEKIAEKGRGSKASRGVAGEERGNSSVSMRAGKGSALVSALDLYHLPYRCPE